MVFDQLLLGLAPILTEMNRAMTLAFPRNWPAI
jgi:hypothetical protein